MKGFRMNFVDQLKSNLQHQTNILGYFDDPRQATPKFDPGLRVVCPCCLSILQAPLVTISLLAEGDNRSFFFRAHKGCWASIDDEEKSLIESAIIDARAPKK